jgi:hypothetical protein
MSPCPLALG